jgi:hypothetical protein
LAISWVDPATDIAHRGLKSSWFDSGVLTDKAFRPVKDTAEADGLSVWSTPEQVKTLSIARGKAIVYLPIHSVVALTLTVQCEQDGHGLIKGIPLVDDDIALHHELVERLYRLALHCEINMNDSWDHSKNKNALG